MGSAAIIAPLVLITWLLWPGTTSTHWGRGALTHAVVIAVLFTVGVLGLRPLFRRQYARLTRDMQVLQREVATQIVRDRTRRKMAQARRGWF
jgi:hypothetical protein